MVSQVRRFNRTVTQRVGALDDEFLARDRPLGQARLLWEIGPDGADVRSHLVDGQVHLELGGRVAMAGHLATLHVGDHHHVRGHEPLGHVLGGRQDVLVIEPRYADPLSLVHYRKVLVTRGAIDQLKEMFA